MPVKRTQEPRLAGIVGRSVRFTRYIVMIKNTGNYCYTSQEGVLNHNKETKREAEPRTAGLQHRSLFVVAGFGLEFLDLRVERDARSFQLAL